MKTSLDPRHKKRQRQVQDLFSLEFQKQHVSPDVLEIVKHDDLLNAKIKEAAPDYPVEKINKNSDQ